MPHMLSWREENAAPWKWLGWGHDTGLRAYLNACKTTRLSPTLSSDTYFFHHINNNPLSHSSFSHPSPPLQTHMKCGWMGNYYVVNITHPTACSFNEIDTKRWWICLWKSNWLRGFAQTTPNQHRNLFSLFNSRINHIINPIPSV